jgi:hypothetical protein
VPEYDKTAFDLCCVPEMRGRYGGELAPEMSHLPCRMAAAIYIERAA